ncbi:DNA-directed RNA polymerase III subunit rpc9 [Spatholobus suberectus]|nr:DNA-directed RNA polymerase III subunit rpc9 [Spatholobus suberectus]
MFMYWFYCRSKGDTFFVQLLILLSLSGFLQMKILEANAGALTNFEVLDFLRAKGASKDPTRVIAKVAQSEYKVYDYLVNTAASVQTRENINEFLTSVKLHDLAKAEVLNIINIRPAADVEIFPIIENCEERFPDEEVTEIVELVKKTLPPPVNMTPEEITKGDKEISTLKEGKGNEISQDLNEGAEQMDTN